MTFPGHMYMGMCTCNDAKGKGKGKRAMSNDRYGVAELCCSSVCACTPTVFASTVLATETRDVLVQPLDTSLWQCAFETRAQETRMSRTKDLL